MDDRCQRQIGMGTESRIQAATPSGLIHESPQTLNETRTTIIDELAQTVDLTVRKQTTTTTRKQKPTACPVRSKIQTKIGPKTLDISSERRNPKVEKETSYLGYLFLLIVEMNI